MRTMRTMLMLTVLLVGSTAPAAAQSDPPVQNDPLFSVLFPPELIMQHRRAIGLTDEQRDAISRMIQDLQGRVVRLQWELLDQVQRLTDTLEGTRVDLDLALDQMSDVLDTEKDIKESHLELLVRIKNLLTPEQQATLTRLRASAGSEDSGAP